MKRPLLLLLIYCIACSFAPSRNYFIEKIHIGRFHYSIYREKEYSRDDDMMAEYFVVYNENKKMVASGFLSGVHNDTAYIKGRYLVTEKTFVAKTYYHYPKRYHKFADSSISVFRPNKNGDLILFNHKDYYKGKVTESRY